MTICMCLTQVSRLDCARLVLHAYLARGRSVPLLLVAFFDNPKQGIPRDDVRICWCRGRFDLSWNPLSIHHNSGKSSLLLHQESEEYTTMCISCVGKVRPGWEVRFTRRTWRLRCDRNYILRHLNIMMFIISWGENWTLAQLTWMRTALDQAEACRDF